MVATIETWTSDINRDLPTTSMADQYAGAFYQLKADFVTAGWTITMSSNGTTANTSDNIASAADVTYGTNVSQVLSYFVARSPSAFGDQIEVMVAADEGNTDTTPQSIRIRCTAGTFTLNGSPLTNAPDAGGTVGRYDLQFNFLNWTTFQAGRTHMVRTAKGGFMFFVSENGSGLVTTAFMLMHMTDSTGEGTHRFWLKAHSGSVNSSSVFTTNGTSAGVDGIVDSTSSAFCTSPPLSLTTWSNGASGFTGVVHQASVNCYTNSSIDGRWVGTVPDIRACSTTTPAGAVDAADTDPVVLVTLGCLVVPVTASQLPILL